MFRHNYKNLFQKECKSDKKSQEGRSFLWANRATPQDFTLASPSKNSFGTALPALGKPRHPSSFTHVNSF